MSGGTTDTVLRVGSEPSKGELVRALHERDAGEPTVRTATSADEALTLLSASDIGCVVADHELPDRDGIELLRAVRETSPDLPFVLCVANGSETLAAEAISAGVTEYVPSGDAAAPDRIATAVESARAERERIEQTALLKRYEQMVNSMYEAACIYDEAGRFELVNEYLAEWYGTTRDALEGQQSTLIAHLRECEDGDPFQELLDGERTELQGELEAEFPGHGHAVLQYRLAPLTADGTVTGVVGVTRDVTELRSRERRLELARTVFEQAQECQFIVDARSDEFELQHANEYYKRMVGLGPDEPAAGQTPTELFGEAGGREILERYAECVDRREPTRYTVEVSVPREGTTYQTILTPVVRDDEVTHIVGTARDITEQQERERELERQNERLDQFASIVSHDLRNPLSVAEGRLELAEEECDSDQLDHVARALDRMDTLIDDLLRLAREGDASVDVRPVPLDELTEDCWRNVETGAVRLAVETNRTIRADEARLKQLLENLFHNAVEHGDTVSTVTVGELDDGFYVEDDGTGIPADEREAVFDVGYSTADGGTGFGLNIVEQIADAHGWRVRATAGTTGGARFAVTGVAFVDE